MKPKLLIVHEFLGLQGGAEQLLLETAEGLASEWDQYLLYSHSTGKGEELFREVFTDCFRKEGSIMPDAVLIHKCLSINKLEYLHSLKAPLFHLVHDHEGYCTRKSKMFPLTQTICPYKAGLCCLFPGLSFLERGKEGNLRFCWKSPIAQQRLISLDQRCSRFFVASEYMKKTLIIQGYDQEKIEILFGVPPPKHKITPAFSDRNSLIFAGQLIKGKGLEPLFEALRQVKVPCRLDIFGTGPDEDYLKQLAKKWNLKARFHGFVRREEMAPFIEQASGAVFPSIWPEPFGMSGVEMMQQGLPVVGFNVGGVGEWLQDGCNGILVDRFDIRGMANAITSLLKDKEGAKKLGKQAESFVNEKFHFPAYIEKLNQELKK